MLCRSICSLYTRCTTKRFTLIFYSYFNSKPMILTVSDFPYGVGTNQKSKFPLSFNKKKGLQKRYRRGIVFLWIVFGLMI